MRIFFVGFISLIAANREQRTSGQSLLLYAPAANQSTPVIHSVQSGTSPPIIVGKRNPVTFSVQPNNGVAAKPMVRRYSIAARPPENLQAAAAGHIQMNGTNLLRRIAADANKALFQQATNPA